MKTAVLKPGYLVSLKSTLRGGVSYARADIEPEHETADGARVAKWETRRAISDPREFERGTEARGKARSVITAVCSQTSFGLLCPLAREGELYDAIEASRKITDEYNAGAALTRVDVYVMVGRIAQDDAEAARAIGAEIRELLDAMRAGIEAANPETIRDAATKARELGQMLSPDVAGQVSDAIREARTVAREIVRRVEKSGERAADVVAQCSVKKIDAARFAFLDVDQAGAAQAVEVPARGIDIEPAAAAVAVSAAAAQLELV